MDIGNPECLSRRSRRDLIDSASNDQSAAARRFDEYGKLRPHFLDDELQYMLWRRARRRDSFFLEIRSDGAVLDPEGFYPVLEVRRGTQSSAVA
jgi:hypothetical protein